MDPAKATVLRYLGCQGQAISPALDELIQESMARLAAVSRPCHVAGLFPLAKGPAGLTLANAGLHLPGQAIACHLAGCGQVALLAATLGPGAEQLIQRWQALDISRALILDACASQAIEAYCDEVEQKICQEAERDGLAATRRFSPGYGDLPLTLQPQLLAALDAGRRIGLTCTASFILLPRKSVTALIGLGASPAATPGGCAACGLAQTCLYRKEEKP